MSVIVHRPASGLVSSLGAGPKLPRGVWPWRAIVSAPLHLPWRLVTCCHLFRCDVAFLAPERRDCRCARDRGDPVGALGRAAPSSPASTQGTSSASRHTSPFINCSYLVLSRTRSLGWSSTSRTRATFTRQYGGDGRGRMCASTRRARALHRRRASIWCYREFHGGAGSTPGR